MNKKIENRRATSNNTNSGQGLSVGNPNNNTYNGVTPQGMQPSQGADGSNLNRSAGQSPAQSLNNIQKISARLRARNNNPVVMSMNNSPQMLLPLSQRSLSPASYAQLQTQNTQDGRGNIMHHPTQMTSQQINSLKQPQVKLVTSGSNGLHSTSPQATQPGSRDFSHQRKILHKSLNSSGVAQAGKTQTSTIDGQSNSRQNVAAKSSGPENRTHHATLNMSNHMISARQAPGVSGDHQTMNGGINSERGPLGQSQPDNNGGIHLNKKFSGHRKRNAREKSYDLYNQKLQLPPMQKPGAADGLGSGPQTATNRANQKQERTYSLPSAGHVHQSMPLSPNMAMQSIGSPKSLNHPVNQRQSINDALKSQMQSIQSNAAPNQNQSRFNYNSGSGLHHSGNHSKMQYNNNQSKTTQPQPQNVNNINGIKGFFSARGQGIRNNNNGTQTTTGASHDLTNKGAPQMHSTRNNQLVNSTNGQITGMFSPRRNIMSGNNNGASFIGMRQNQHSSQRQGSSKIKNNQAVQSLSINTNLNAQFQNSEKGKQPSSASHQEEIRMRQSLTLSPKVSSSAQNQTPVPQANPQSRDAPQTASSNPQTSSSSPDQETTDGKQTDGNTTAASSADRNSSSRLSSTHSQDGNVQFVEVQTLLFGENPPVLNPKTLFLKNHEPTKASQKKCGVIKSYAANTNQGIIRDYNEDRVSIILNILKPKSKQHLTIEWPQICFFGVFDGHGGAACADYLRDNLHNFVVQNENFPQFPHEAIVGGFKECERSFINLVEVAQTRAQNAMPGQQVGPERSGSCATVVMIIDDMAYVINVGDSRCLMSIDAGTQIAVLSRDHKPDDEHERIRIQAAGGKIYRTQTFAKAATSPDEKDLYVQGPLRVFPGRLSVSRTFGDIEAKRERFGGNPKVIVCDPEIRSFKLKNNFDFFFIGCDGIFERLDNKQVIEACWNRFDEQITSKTPDALSPNHPVRNGKGKMASSRTQQFHYDEHIAAAEGVEISLREAAASRSLDNITVLILGLKNLKTTIKKMNEGKTLQQVRHQAVIDARGIPHTYDRDFEYLEVNEQDLNLLSDNDVNSANDSLEADAIGTVEEDKNKKVAKTSLSPQHKAAKAPPSRQTQSTSVGAIHRKF